MTEPIDSTLIRRSARETGVPVCDAILRGVQRAGRHATLLAVCPNSEAVLRASVESAKDADAPLVFAATLNQVDLDGGYTGWTQAAFVERARNEVREIGFDGPVIVGLDHGGPWLKDLHSREQWPFEKTWTALKDSLTACIESGYDLLHIDPTVDRDLPGGESMPVELVVERTVELIAHAETERTWLGKARVSYEVGTEEVHGGLADTGAFRSFLEGLKTALAERGLEGIWPCFVVAQVGTNLHTTSFEPEMARSLVEIAAEYGSWIKGHYTDYVTNPEEYPETGIGGANVGPEFTDREYETLVELCRLEEDARPQNPSGLRAALERAVAESGRWKKWLQPDEKGKPFAELDPERRYWLVRTGCRYIWSAPAVVDARDRLSTNLSPHGVDAKARVVDRIKTCMREYYRTFGLEGINSVLEQEGNPL